MILHLDLQHGRNNEVTNALPSRYEPTEEEKEMLAHVLHDYETANQIRNQSYREFNDRNLIDYQDDSQRAFNLYVDPPSNDPDEAWRSNTVRPITRNRVISIAAHITGAIMQPKIFAQNANQEEDKAAAEVMRALMDFSNEQARYAQTFLYSVIAALVNPAVIIHTEYAETMRKIKRRLEDGTIEVKEILDELFSGFQDAIVPVDELFIGDIYQHNIQKQPFLIRRRILDYAEAERIHGHHENWQYVQPGIQAVFDEQHQDFYDQEDEELEGRLVEELIYHTRTEDLEQHVVNGILMTDPENPNPREDKSYPYAKGGYELIDEGKFFYYRSLADKLHSDQVVVDQLYSMIIDGTYLEIMPPTAIFGEEEMDASVVAPGLVTSFQNPDTKLQRISPGHNLNAGLNVLEKVESSINESSQDTSRQGVSAPGSQTAFEIARLEQNAKVMLGLFGKMIGFLVKEWGILRIGDILQYLTLGDISETSSPGNAIRYKSILVGGDGGDTLSRKIEFESDLGDMEQSFQLLEQEGLDPDKRIYKVNPVTFRELQYKIIISPDLEIPPSDALQKALNLELYDRAINNPNADQEQVFRDLLLGSYSQTRDEPDRYMRKPGQAVTGDQADAAKDLISQITGGSRPGLNELIKQ